MEKLEGDYADTEVVEQIWIYGTSTESFLVAVVVPDKRKLEAWASDAGVEGSFEDLAKSDQVPISYAHPNRTALCACESHALQLRCCVHVQ